MDETKKNVEKKTHEEELTSHKHRRTHCYDIIRLRGDGKSKMEVIERAYGNSESAKMCLLFLVLLIFSSSRIP